MWWPVKLLAFGMLLHAFITPSHSGKMQHDHDDDKITDGNHSPDDSVSQNTVSGDAVKIEFDHYKLATGKDVEFHCVKNNASLHVYWINPSGEDIAQLNNSRFQSDSNGWLNITDLRLNDTGEYTCQAVNSTYNDTIGLEVYLMPDYFVAGMVVLGINIGLIALFCVCLGYKTVKERKLKAKYSKCENVESVNSGITASTPGSNGDIDTQGIVSKPHNKRLDIV